MAFGPQSVKKTGSYVKLARIYKQLNASFGGRAPDPPPTHLYSPGHGDHRRRRRPRRALRDPPRHRPRARVAPAWSDRWGWHATDELDADSIARADGVWMAPGTPYRSRDAALAVIRHAREHDQPILGSCGGFQHMLLEFARSVAGIDEAEHEEEQPAAQTLLLTRLSCSLIGLIRPVTTVPGTRAATVCGPGPFDGFHYCNFGLAPEFEERLVAAGLVISGHAPDAGVEIVELPAHAFYVGTMFQPQMSPGPHGRQHPLLEAFFASVDR